MHGFHHVANGCDEFNQLLFRLRGADLRENVPTREEPHLQNLAEQSRMDRRKASNESRIETLRGT